jgi:hypothetical protein
MRSLIAYGAMVLGTVLATVFCEPHNAQAGHLFSQFGMSPQQINVGEGIEFRLGGTQDVHDTNPTIAFYLHLFFNEDDPFGPATAIFSPGDVLRFTMGGVSIIYDFDNPGNITDLGGFFDEVNTFDLIGNGDPVAEAFAAGDSNGQNFSLEVLAGDGVLFAGLEMADLVAGTFQKGGASTFVRKFNVKQPDKNQVVYIDFEDLPPGIVIEDQYTARGVTFFGDEILNEQIVVDLWGVGFDSLDGNMLVNKSSTPPLNETGYIGMVFNDLVTEVRFNFYSDPDRTLKVAGFKGDFTQDSLLFIEELTIGTGSTGLPEGTADISFPDGFDGLIIFGGKAREVAIDNLSIMFIPYLPIIIDRIPQF